MALALPPNQKIKYRVPHVPGIRAEGNHIEFAIHVLCLMWLKLLILEGQLGPRCEQR